MKEGKLRTQPNICPDMGVDIYKPLNEAPEQRGADIPDIPDIPHPLLKKRKRVPPPPRPRYFRNEPTAYGTHVRYVRSQFLWWFEGSPLPVIDTQASSTTSIGLISYSAPVSSTVAMVQRRPSMVQFSFLPSLASALILATSQVSLISTRNTGSEDGSMIFVT